MAVLAGISKQIAESLLQDGFSQPSGKIFVKKWDDTWRGWLAIDSSPHLLIPIVGVLSEELLDIRVRALKKLGIRWKKRKDGPPLIMINLPQLVDSEERSRISWSYTGKELQAEVADDVVHCFRKWAYPYIGVHANYEAVLDAVMKEGRASPSLPLYLPMILIKLGRLDYLSKLVNAQHERAVCEDVSISYQQYVEALLEIEEQNGKQKT